MEEKELLQEFKEKIEEIEITWDYESVFSDLYNITDQYESKGLNLHLYYIFEDYHDYDTIEQMARYEFEHGDLERLCCFIGDTRFYGNNLFKIDGYGNCENVDKSDLEYIKEEILSNINNRLEEVE